ncbi:hypothetical protein C8A00DRAFT_16250 [Chaetomidium leptoderma]|uniref:Uncharacterized protein n=1 Tax=Chaetomidium leptoderma TaxID=669021 RepID=A0AAN6ZVH0_9PEZI|nr:hypothetical protein C8A00DRAFT_16250 [Chaetomidium leptoderma]
MAPAPPSRPHIKGPLQPPRPPPTTISYTQAPRIKSETDVNLAGSNQVAYKDVSLTTLPQPFVNPGDAFSQLKLSARGES